MNPAQKISVFAIRAYQLVVSPVLLAATGPAGRCRFTPSCSEYALLAVRHNGLIKGSWLAAGRLCRCHPWGNFGVDYPPGAGDRKRSSALPASVAPLKECHGS